jgi:DNA-binding protein H-NS
LLAQPEKETRKGKTIDSVISGHVPAAAVIHLRGVGEMARSEGSGELDLDNLSDDQLQALRERVNAEIDERLQNRIAEVRTFARLAGYELSLSKIAEFQQGQERRRRSAPQRAPVQPKYRNPANSSETWSGRGRKPGWLERELAAGRQVSEFEIT